MQDRMMAGNLRNKKELVLGESVSVPLLEDEATVIAVKGKNCFAQLKKLGAIVSFQLN